MFRNPSNATSAVGPKPMFVGAQGGNRTCARTTGPTHYECVGRYLVLTIVDLRQIFEIGKIFVAAASEFVHFEVCKSNDPNF